MRKHCYILFLFLSFVGFAQKKILKKFELNSKTLVVDTKGLDNLKIENTTSNFVTVELFTRSYDDRIIKIDEQKDETTISFYFEGEETREVIFRKFITKRIQRAEAVIRIPDNISITIYGENVDVQSKSCKNPLSIYLDNGIIKLGKINHDTLVKFYSGNVYALVTNTSLDLTSNVGKISIDDKLYQKKFTKKEQNLRNKLTIQTISGNIFLTHN